jgi:uncharacterized protein YbjT (DUF2867 family)
MRLDDPRARTEAVDGIRRVVLARGSIGIQGALQRIAITPPPAPGRAGHPLSVPNTSVDSPGINQRAHHSIDQFASATAVPYSRIRPAIFSASLLAAAPEVHASRTWTGLGGSGRMALIDHRDAAEAGVGVLTDPALWDAHHDRTGPVSLPWPEALELLSAELGEPLTFRVAAERQFSSASSAPGDRPGRLSCSSRARGDPRRRERPHDRPFQQITGHPRARWPSSFTSTTRNSSTARALGWSFGAGRYGFFEHGFNSHIQDCRAPRWSGGGSSVTSELHGSDGAKDVLRNTTA